MNLPQGNINRNARLFHFPRGFFRIEKVSWMRRKKSFSHLLTPSNNSGLISLSFYTGWWWWFSFEPCQSVSWQGWGLSRSSYSQWVGECCCRAAQCSSETTQLEPSDTLNRLFLHHQHPQQEQGFFSLVTRWMTAAALSVCPSVCLAVTWPQWLTRVKKKLRFRQFRPDVSLQLGCNGWQHPLLPVACQVCNQIHLQLP